MFKVILLLCTLGVAYAGQAQAKPDVPSSFESLMLQAKENPTEVHIHIQKTNLSADQVFEIAKVAAQQSGLATSMHIENFGITDQTHLFEIAKVAAQQSGWETSAHIKSYGITNQTHLFEIAKVAAQQDGAGTSAHIKSYGITNQTHLFEIAKTATAQDGAGTSVSIKKYGIINQAHLLKIATIAAQKDGWGTSIHIKNYGITNQMHLFEIAKVAAQQVGFKTINHLSNYNLTASQNDIVRRMAIYFHPESYLRSKGHIRDDHIKLRELKAVFLNYADTYPDECSPEDIKRSWDKVQNKEVGLRLIRFHEKARQRGVDISGDSTDLLLEGLGFKKDFVSAIKAKLDKLSSNALGDFYTVILDLDFNLTEFSFLDIAIEQKLWNKNLFKTKLLPFFTILRDLTQLRGNTDGSYQSVIVDLNLKKGILNSNIDNLFAQAKRLLTKEFEMLFKNNDLKFSHEDFAKLQARWGNLEPIFTLIARFRGKADWHMEIPHLARVFKAVLNESFFDLKFNGDALDANDQQNAKEQLKAIWQSKDPKAAFEAWTSIWSQAQAVSNNQVSGTGQQQIISTHLSSDIEQLTTHFREGLVTQQSSTEIEESVKQSIRENLSKIKSNPKEFLENIKNKYSLSEGALIEIAIEEITKLNDTKPEYFLEKIKKLILSLNKLKNVLSISPEIRNQVGQDLQGILKRFKSTDAQAGKGSKNAIIFSTTFHDPKLLLIVGDLVKGVSSCQNYKVGGYIQTLLGYVLDANVQGILSFELGPNDLTKPSLFNELFERLERNNGSVSHHFNPNTSVIEFSWQDEKGQNVTMETNKVAAFQRNIIKLGAADGVQNTAGIFIEKAYGQIKKEPTMQAATHMLYAIVSTMLSKMGGKVASSVKMTASTRNSGGIYSDAAGGIKKEAYEIKVRQSQQEALKEALHIATPSRKPIAKNQKINEPLKLSKQDQNSEPAKQAFASKVKSHVIKGASTVGLAEEIKNLFFSAAEWDLERFKQFNTQLIEHPIEFLAGFEGFVLTEKGVNKLLDLRASLAANPKLAKWPLLRRFSNNIVAKVAREDLPMAIAMFIMQLIHQAVDKYDELVKDYSYEERMLLESWTIESILMSISVYGDAFSQVLSDKQTWIMGGKTIIQFAAALRSIKGLKKALRVKNWWSAGAKARMAHEMGSLNLGGWLLAGLDLSSVFILDELFDHALPAYMSVRQERLAYDRLKTQRWLLKDALNTKGISKEKLKEHLKQQSLIYHSQEAVFNAQIREVLIHTRVQASEIYQAYIDKKTQTKKTFSEMNKLKKNYDYLANEWERRFGTTDSKEHQIRSEMHTYMLEKTNEIEQTYQQTSATLDQTSSQRIEEISEHAIESLALISKEQTAYLDDLIENGVYDIAQINRVKNAPLYSLVDPSKSLKQKLTHSFKSDKKHYSALEMATSQEKQNQIFKENAQKLLEIISDQ